MSPVLLVSVESQPASGLLKGQRPGCPGTSGVCPLVQAIREMTSSGFRILIWVKGVGWATSSLRFFSSSSFLGVASVCPRARNGENSSFTLYCGNSLR